jgi:hypothetical protein
LVVVIGRRLRKVERGKAKGERTEARGRRTESGPKKTPNVQRRTPNIELEKRAEGNRGGILERIIAVKAIDAPGKVKTPGVE